MNNKTKTILLFIVFILFIGIAVFAYNMLGKSIASKRVGVTSNRGEASRIQSRHGKRKDESA